MKVLLDINVVLDVFACAVEATLDAIVTRNPKDFGGSPVLILTPAELRGGQRMQGFANNAEAPPRGVLDAAIGVSSRGAAQDRQRLRRRLPQRRLFAESRDIVRKARRLVIIGRRR